MENIRSYNIKKRFTRFSFGSKQTKTRRTLYKTQRNYGYIMTSE